MQYVAHNCVLEDEVIMANAATIGGHTHVGFGAWLGGYERLSSKCKGWRNGNSFQAPLLQARISFLIQNQRVYLHWYVI